MVVIEVFGCFLFATAVLVIVVGGNVVQVNKLATSLFDYFSIPLPIGVVAALYMAVFPLVARCEAPFSLTSSMNFLRYQPKL